MVKQQKYMVLSVMRAVVKFAAFFIVFNAVNENFKDFTDDYVMLGTVVIKNFS